MEKTFNDLNIGDEIFKVHIDFEHDNCQIERKIIKDRKLNPSPVNINKVIFYFDNFGPESLMAIYEAYCELDLQLSTQRYFECHDMMQEIHKMSNGEFVYYTVTMENAEDLLKLKLLEYIKHLNREINYINDKIKNAKKLLKSFK